MPPLLTSCFYVLARIPLRYTQVFAEKETIGKVNFNIGNKMKLLNVSMLIFVGGLLSGCLEEARFQYKINQKPTGCAASDSYSNSPFSNSDDTSAGTMENPYIICTLAQLDNIRTNLEAHYALGTDIDASSTQTMGDYVDPDATPSTGDEYYTGFEPIGECATNNCSDVGDEAFLGSFDGNGYEIRNLSIKGTSKVYNSLFVGTCLRDGSYTCSDAADFIKNLKLVNVDFYHGTGKVAPLVGLAGTTTIENISISGSLDGSAVGGIVFDSFGTLSNVYSYSDISAQSNPSGGITALLRGGEGTIKNCAYEGELNANSAGSDIGGIVGYANGSEDMLIQNCYSTGNIIAPSASGVAGIIASFAGTGTLIIRNTFSTGDITVSTGDSVAGIMGRNTSGTATLVNAFSTGNITGRKAVGGLVGNGETDTSIKNCFASGTIVGSTSTNYPAVGGLFGVNVTDMQDCYYKGTSVTGKHNVGGIVGWAGGNATNIARVYSSADIITTDNNCSGGIAGCAQALTLQDSFALGDVSIATNNDDAHGEVLGYIDTNPTSNFTDIFYLDSITLNNTGTGIPLDHSSFALAQPISYFQGPLSSTNSDPGEVYANWDFTNIWDIQSGSLPTLRCPSDDASTTDIDETWELDCSDWLNNQ